MTSKTLPLLLLICLPALAQVKTEEIPSDKLKETREITIATPSGYDLDANKDRKYPLIVLLDGNYLLEPFSGIMSYTSYWDDLPQAIIVGINEGENGQREDDTQTDPQTGLPLNKGNQFFEFITSELLPYIEKKYRIADFKVIAGHDLTAGYLNFFLYKDNPAFDAYISFSPELPLDMETRLPQMLATVKKPVFYYLATADGDVNRIRDSIKSMDSRIKDIKNPSLHYFFRKFDNATHYSLVAQGIPDALYDIFAVYQPISSQEYKDKIVTLSSGYVDYLKKKYDDIEKELGIKMPIRLNDFRAIEAAIMKNGAYDELKDLSDVADKNYPKTAIGKYYEGLYYEMTGDLKRAKKVYLSSYTTEDIGSYTKDYMLDRASKLNTD